MTNIRVNLGNNSYSIAVGVNETDRLPGLLKKHIKTDRLFVVYDSQFFALHGLKFTRLLKRLNVRLLDIALPQGEAAKTASMLGILHDFFLSEKISRTDLVLACGGGAATDLAGFAAATVLRGVPWAVVPSTLLGMVDAAIGGKTAINHGTGKNLIGTLWQPRFVICDIRYLDTLPVRQMISGLGEVLKYAAISGPPLPETLKQYLNRGDLFNHTSLVKLVTASARIKADIVSQDERETRLRMMLNLGHTFGHAIEHVTGYAKILHGEAITIGLLGAIELSILLKPSRSRRLEPLRQLAMELISFIPTYKVNTESVMDAMRLDKKRSGEELKFILLDAVGKPFIKGGIAKSAVKEATDMMLHSYRQTGGKIV